MLNFLPTTLKQRYMSKAGLVIGELEVFCSEGTDFNVGGSLTNIPGDR